MTPERTPTASPGPLARILVAFDGSPHARRACALASEIAGRFHSHVTIAVVRAGGDGSAELSGLVPVTDDGRSMDSLVEELVAQGRAQGAADVQVVVLEGEVEETLLAYLHRAPQDLAVVGSRGLTRGRRLLLGSVSAGLVNGAPCPVLVVRAPPSRRSGAAGEPGPGRP